LIFALYLKILCTLVVFQAYAREAPAETGPWNPVDPSCGWPEGSKCVTVSEQLKEHPHSLSEKSRKFTNKCYKIRKRK
jgi:hypothetical protein